MLFNTQVSHANTQPLCYAAFKNVVTDSKRLLFWLNAKHVLLCNVFQQIVSIMITFYKLPCVLSFTLFQLVIPNCRNYKLLLCLL